MRTRPSPSGTAIVRLRRAIRDAPVIGRLLVNAKHSMDLRLRRVRFRGSARYWEARYAAGGTSGTGSYDLLAAFKAEVLNGFVRDRDVRSVIEWGCGDGNQLMLARYPRYLGLDVSPLAVKRCRELFAHDETKEFALVSDYDGRTAELALSLDVIYHLTEDDVYERHLASVFSSARRFVIIYSSDAEIMDAEPHVRHRRFTPDVERLVNGWRLANHISNRYPLRIDPDHESPSEFFIYEKVDVTESVPGTGAP